MSERSRVRLFVLHVVVISLLLTLFGRLWYMQVLTSTLYQAKAYHNQTRTVSLPAPRGQILDDYGRPLASNKAMLVVSVERAMLDKQADHGVAVLHRLADALHLPYQQVYDETRYCYEKKVDGCWPGEPLAPIPVETLPDGTANTRLALMIEERQSEFPGVTAALQGVRDYPQKTVGSHLVGYVGAITADDEKSGKYAGYQPFAKIGKSGLEASYEQQLRGTDGSQTLGVDFRGHISGVVGEKQPTPGDNVVLSLDTGVQSVLQQALAHLIATAPTLGRNASHPKNAAGVVVDTRTGHIVAMASYPTYDANVLATRPLAQKTYNKLAKNNGLLDLAVQGQFPPGSTFKMISSSAAVAEGIATWNGSYACPSEVQFGKGEIKRNSESESFPPLSLHDAIMVSCDTVFYNFAKQEYARDYQRVVKEHKKPIEEVVKMAQAFGLDAQTGVDLPDESTGTIIGWAGKRQMAAYYHTQFCRGANGYTDNAGVHHPPQKNPQRRAEDRQRCDHPDPGDALFLPGDQANMDIGQGTVTATPLQMAMVYAAVANGGTVYSPRIAKAVVSPNGQQVTPVTCPVRGHLPVSKATKQNLLDALYAVTQKPKGTAYGAFKGFPFGKVDVGGKTGTAQVVGHPDTSWFASVAGPARHAPQYAMVIVVPDGGFGAALAAPAVREVWDGIYGLEGHAAALPGGVPPKALPEFNPNGTVATKPPVTTHKRATTGHAGTHARKASHTPAPGTTSALGLPPSDLPIGWRSVRAKGAAS